MYLKSVNDYVSLAKLSKNSNPNRLESRDRIDGRSRGDMRKFEFYRIKFRELAHQGLISGVKKLLILDYKRIY